MQKYVFLLACVALTTLACAHEPTRTVSATPLSPSLAALTVVIPRHAALRTTYSAGAPLHATDHDHCDQLVDGLTTSLVQEAKAALQRAGYRVSALASNSTDPALELSGVAHCHVENLDEVVWVGDLEVKLVANGVDLALSRSPSLDDSDDGWTTIVDELSQSAPLQEYASRVAGQNVAVSNVAAAAPAPAAPAAAVPGPGSPPTPGSDHRARLGFRYEPEGLRITELDPGGPGELAGLRAGDRITAVNGAPTRSPPDLVAAVYALTPGSSVAVTVERNGSSEVIRVTAGSTDDPWYRTAADNVYDPSKWLVAAPQPASYAFIVGIDQYRDVPAAPGGELDAKRNWDLVVKTLGLREDHVRVALGSHATRSDLQNGLEWLRDSVTAGGRAYFFFSGHGAPSADGTTFLVPYDADPRAISSTGLATEDVLKQLGTSKARDVLAIIDACFSGTGGRSVLPPGARPLMPVKAPAASPRIALFTASAGNEISGSAPGQLSGVFSKFVLEGLSSGQADINGDGQVTLQELNDWVAPRVARDAKKENREQHPTLSVGQGLAADDFVIEYGLPTK